MSKTRYRNTPNRFNKDSSKSNSPKFLKRKHLVLLSSLLLLLLVPTVAFTLAYKTDSTEEIKNIFNPKEVVIEIQEDFDGAEKENVAVKNTGELPAYIRFKIAISAVDEEGNIVALPIREINTTTATSNLSNRGISIDDFTITQSNWKNKFIEDDGIYYYPELVDVEEVVDIFEKATFNLPIFDPTVVDLPLPLIDDAGNPYYVFDKEGNLCYKYDNETKEYLSYSQTEMTENEYTSMLDENGKFTYMLSTYNPVITITAESVQANGVQDAWGVVVNDDKISLANE